jgi:hypothetical protein
MPSDHPDAWYLKKHDDGEIFGPVPLSRIVEWAGTAQIAPQDSLSTDTVVWTKAPMIPDLKMDWLVKLDDDHFYGPTTSGALLEFLDNNEISGTTLLIDCCSGRELPLSAAPFYPQPDLPGREYVLTSRAPSRGTVRLSLQKRIRELEVALLEKRRQLDVAADTIHRLETRIKELEARIRDITGLSPSR